MCVCTHGGYGTQCPGATMHCFDSFVDHCSHISFEIPKREWGGEARWSGKFARTGMVSVVKAL